jgi:hypothetical protein
MSTDLQETISHLRDEVRQLTSDALAQSGDKAARWQRSLEIKALTPSLQERIDALPAGERPELEKALGQINGGLIFLLAPSNQPDDLPGATPSSEQTTEAAVRRIYSQSLKIAGDFALERGDRAALRLQAEELRRDLIDLAKSGANQQPEWQRMLSDANLDLTYVTSDGKRPHSTRLAHYVADERRAGNGG